MIEGLLKGYFGALLADPPWRFRTYDNATKVKPRGSKNAAHYSTMTVSQIMRTPVEELAAKDCALFLWVTWPNLLDGLKVIEAWGFEYKTCAFAWMKGHAGQIEMFRDDGDPLAGMGYWTRANTECCLLATRGKPKRIRKDIRQAIFEPRREHSRKPDAVYERIEGLVEGPYCELWARTQRAGWAAAGDQVGKFSSGSV